MVTHGGEMLRWSRLSRYQTKVGSEILRYESMHTGFLALRHRLSLTCTRRAHGEEVAEPRQDGGLGYLLGLSPPWGSRQEDRRA